MRKLRLYIAVAILLLLSACGEVAGPVVEKDYKPAHEQQYEDPQYTYMCVPVTAYDAQGRMYTATSCNYVLTHYVTKTRHIPDEWLLRVRDEESDKKKWVTVTHSVYDSKDIGDFYTNKDNADEDGNF